MKKSHLRGGLYALIFETVCWLTLYLSSFTSGGLLPGLIVLGVLYLFSYAVYVRLCESLYRIFTFDISALAVHAVFLTTAGILFTNATEQVWKFLNDDGWFAGLQWIVSWFALIAAFGLQTLIFFIVHFLRTSK